METATSFFFRSTMCLFKAAIVLMMSVLKPNNLCNADLQYFSLPPNTCGYKKPYQGAGMEPRLSCFTTYDSFKTNIALLFLFTKLNSFVLKLGLSF